MDVDGEATVVMGRGGGKKRSLEGGKKRMERRQKMRAEAVGAQAARRGGRDDGSVGSA